jgi:hypothetical protein
VTAENEIAGADFELTQPKGRIERRLENWLMILNRCRSLNRIKATGFTETNSVPDC